MRFQYGMIFCLAACMEEEGPQENKQENTYDPETTTSTDSASPSAADTAELDRGENVRERDDDENTRALRLVGLGSTSTAYP